MSKARIRSTRYRSSPSRRRRVLLGFLSGLLTPTFYFLAFIAALLVLGVMFLVQPTVAAATAFAEWLAAFFGLGLVLLLILALLIAFLAWRGQLANSLAFWRRWLAALVFGLAAEGFGAFLVEGPASAAPFFSHSAGGFLGQATIGTRSIGGAARLVALCLLAVVILRPRRSWDVLTKFAVAGFGALRANLPRAWASLRTRVEAIQERRRIAAGMRHEELVLAEAVVAESIEVPAEPVTNQEKAMSQPEKEEILPLVTTGKWQLPPADILDRAQETELTPADSEARARKIEEALASYGVDAKVVQVNCGPAITQFGVEPGWDVKYKTVKERDADGKVKLDKDGNPKVRQEEVSRTRVKVERINSLANDLALALAAPSVRIEAPVPGKALVGIEVPNVSTGMVSLRSVMESTGFQRMRGRSRLAIALGKGVSGEAVVGDLAKMPHLLIAGATGSGKSVCINSIIACLLANAMPDEVRFLMIDPKRVELVSFNSIPHLLAPVVVEMEQVVGILRWVTKEMDRRYTRMASAGVRNIEGYNRSPRMSEPMPYLVVIIDELADLMMVAPYEVERTICRLAQLARATGIHLIIATQRPSVDVVTGLIKANFPTRISFAVTSQVDSRTILDMAGAEKLLGQGDMLYMPTDAAKPKRLQGCFVSDQEIEKLVKFWANDKWSAIRPPQYAEEIAEAVAQEETGAEDALMDKARKLAEEAEHVSTSLLQRRLKIGYPRAARLMEALEEEGAVAHESRHSKGAFSAFEEGEDD